MTAVPCRTIAVSLEEPALCVVSADCKSWIYWCLNLSPGSTAMCSEGCWFGSGWRRKRLHGWVTWCYLWQLKRPMGTGVSWSNQTGGLMSFCWIFFQLGKKPWILTVDFDVWSNCLGCYTSDIASCFFHIIFLSHNCFAFFKTLSKLLGGGHGAAWAMLLMLMLLFWLSTSNLI